MGDNETWCTGFNNDNYRKTGRLDGDEIIELAPHRDNIITAAVQGDRFGAAHPDGWNMAMCDGSVQTISYEVDWRIHRDAGNRMDSNLHERPSH
jgi:prepilin-type processing-associated H-X9-DG protein